MDETNYEFTVNIAITKRNIPVVLMNRKLDNVQNENIENNLTEK